MTKSHNNKQWLKVLALAFGLGIPAAVQAQNAIQHYTSTGNNGSFAATDNKSIDYITGMPWGDGYILSGGVSTSNIGGNNNVGPSGNIPRFQLLALDGNNQTQWVNTYVDQRENNSGPCPSMTLAVAFSVADAKQTSDGGFIVCGRAYKTADISSCTGITDFDMAFLLKTDQAGIPQWSMYYRDVIFTSVIEDISNPNGYQYIVCGSNNQQQALYMFTDASGLPLASGIVNDLSGYNEVTIEDVGGNKYYSFTGWVKGGDVQVRGARILLTTLDQNGSIIISKKYDFGGTWVGVQFPWGFEWIWHPHTFNGTGINDAFDGEHVAICATATMRWYDFDKPGNLDIVDAVIMKADPLTGNVQWVYRYMESGFENAFMANSISVKKETKEIAITGLRYVMDNTNALITTGAMYLETDPSGTVNRQVTYAPDLGYEGKSITFNSNSNYFVYSGNVSTNSYSVRNNYDADCDPDQYTSIYAPEYEVFDVDMVPFNVSSTTAILEVISLPATDIMPCGMLKPAPTGVAETQKKNSFVLAPNPTTGNVTLTFSNLAPYESAHVKVTDMLGQVVYRKPLAGKSKDGKIDIQLGDNLAPGQYVVTMYCDEKQVTVQRLSKLN